MNASEGNLDKISARKEMNGLFSLLFAFIIYLPQDSTNREEMIYCVRTVTSGMDESCGAYMV